ncbi:hypothetical protein [Stenomitos frigidus]|uniref:Uncharacterized protein n=1 Tax=Stenomitos frigidus ULC18 TaxID=2107698 RepID=A0A2T1DWV1_9CYAN|nr:hypothetical protein [Stenomitos frigidus]PSB24960.1 hypothetical protein C7B82_24965 [Stenomitos frigidus ULC18]
MSYAINCFRTITRLGIFRQVKIEGAIVLVPVGIPASPKKVGINPGDSIEEPTELTMGGKLVPSFSYVKESKSEIEIEFDSATTEIEQLIHGNVVGAGTNVHGYVYAEFNTASLPPARVEGQIGYSVTAQDANSKAQVSYIDLTTKLSAPIAVEAVDATLAGDQITIDAHMSFTVSAALAEKAVEVHAWVPCVIPTAAIITAKPIGLVSVFAQGINHDDTARLVIARNCARLAGGQISSDPGRSVKLRILPDVTDGTGLGYQIIDTPLETAA